MTDRPAGRRRAKRTQAENPITIYPAWCKRCGLCVAFCPKEVLEAGPDGLPRVARPEECISCGLCELRCPDFAISLGEPKEKEPNR